MNNQIKPVNVRLHQADYEAVKNLAEKLDLKTAEVFRRALRLGCETLRHVSFPGSRETERTSKDS